jgi:oligogalacturonide lyase
MGRLAAVALFLAAGAVAEAAGVGRLLPSERREMEDEVTGNRLVALTTDPANDAKPYQTHPTWTSDGRWVLFRADRGGSGRQAFLVNEASGNIVQLTEGPATDTGSLNLARRTNRLFYVRGTASPGPRQLVELSLDPLLADALARAAKPAAAYERVVASLPGDLRDSGGFALDADETTLYWGVTWGPRPPAPAAPARSAAPDGGRRAIDDANLDPTESREKARARFEAGGRGPGGIRSIDLRTGAIRAVLDVPFRMGHVQANPWVPGEILYCHETTGDAPQRMWTVRSDGTGNRPLYVETPDEWVTHETFSGKDEVMFNLMGHLPYLRERPSGLAVVDLRTGRTRLLAQIDEDLPGGRTGGLWHGNGSPDGRWAVSDSFRGDVYLIDRRTGERILLTTGHRMTPDHAHPIFSPDGRRVLVQSGRLTDGRSLDLIVAEIPSRLLDR